jgi:hypothetical protein
LVGDFASKEKLLSVGNFVHNIREEETEQIRSPILLQGRLCVCVVLGWIVALRRRRRGQGRGGEELHQDK